MSRRAWTWGGALLLAGVLVVVLELHAIATYRPPSGSPETATLGQIVGLLFGAGLCVVGGLVLGTGVRRRFDARRRRRLRDQLAARDQ